MPQILCIVLKIILKDTVIEIMYDMTALLEQYMEPGTFRDKM